MSCLKVIIIVGKGFVGGLVKFGFVLGKESLIDLDFSGGKCGGGDKFLDGVLVSVVFKCDMKENI